MLFHSLEFLALLVAVAALSALLRGDARRLVLLGASAVFYASFDPRFLALLALVVVVDHGVARRIAATQDRALRRRLLWISVAVDLGALATFKYYGFFAGALAQLFEVFGATPPWHVTGLLLPVGISFYVFQSLGYVFDVHRGRAEPARLLDYALFLAFFPKLAAGPIERASGLLAQIRADPPPTVERSLAGGWLILIGLFKKVALADPLGLIVDPHLASGLTGRGGDAVLVLVLAGTRIYADFSGYTDVARGAGRLLGYELAPNFRQPLFARNVQEFWGRWNMTLSLWIRDYLYYPMALNRRLGPRLGTGGLAVVTMVVMGIWHGASWNFVLWGLYHGFLLALYGRLRPRLHRIRTALVARGRKAWDLAGILATQSVVFGGGIFFATADLAAAGNVLAAIAVPPWGAELRAQEVGVALAYVLAILLLDLLEARSASPEPWLRWPWGVRRGLQAVLAAGIAAALLLGRPQLPYQYFQF